MRKLKLAGTEICQRAPGRGHSCGSTGQESACSSGELGWEDPLEKQMAMHSSTLAWKVPWTEEPGGLQSLRSQESDSLVIKPPPHRASLVAQLVKNLPTVWETWVWSLHWEDPLEKGKATHSNILAWKIPWTVWSMGSQRVGHDWVTFTFTPAEWVMGPVSVQPWASPAPPSLHGSL